MLFYNESSVSKKKNLTLKMTSIDACASCEMFALLKARIDSGEMYTGGLMPQLSGRDQESACVITDDFIANTEKTMECFGTTSWGMRQHFIYRHNDGKLYTFCVSNYMEEVGEINFLRSFDPVPCDDFDFTKPDELTLGTGSGMRPQTPDNDIDCS